MYDNKTSIEYIESRFPELGEALHDEIIDGLLHPQLGEFSRLAWEEMNEYNRSIHGG